MTQITSIRTITARSAGGAHVLTTGDTARPTPGPGEVVVDVAHAGVNFIDTYRRSGVYPAPFPHVPGTEGTGVVSAVGDGADAAVGDRVAWCDPVGSYAEAVTLPADRLLPVPDTLPLDVAAALPLQGLTAHYLCTSTHRVGPGQTVVVTAAAGGVGHLLTQLCVARGARVLGTVGSPEKIERARAAGADEVLCLATVRDPDGLVGDGFPAWVRELTGGEGAHAVFDGIGRATFDGSLAAVRVRGTLAVFGGASGQVPPFDIQRLNSAGSVLLARPTLAHHVADREELLSRWEDVAGAAACGELDVHIGGRVPLARAREAHEALESGTTTGKILLDVRPEADTRPTLGTTGHR